ncbi:MAG: hypothetical protein LKJ46_10730 [Lactobacillus sp.]|nr:hypothetical protein [Lactobacillus sp.]MCI1973084.1 hypothetical protein [Lactobacillus sp.]
MTKLAAWSFLIQTHACMQGITSLRDKMKLGHLAKEDAQRKRHQCYLSR